MSANETPGAKSFPASAFTSPMKTIGPSSIPSPLTPGSAFEFGFTPEKPALVIEIGSAYTKVGFAGESAPRYIIPSRFSLLNGKELKPQKAIGTKRITKSEWKEAMEVTLNEIYFKYLQANTKDERKVVVVENLISLTHLREALMETLYEKFKVSSIMFVPSQALAIVPLNRSSSTGLIVDCGYSETRILPIYEGIPLIHALQLAPFGSRSIQERLLTLLKDHSTVRNTFSNESFAIQSLDLDALTATVNVGEVEPLCIDSKVLEDVITRMCFVEPSHSNKIVQKVSHVKLHKDSQGSSTASAQPSPWPQNENKPLKHVEVTNKVETSGESIPTTSATSSTSPTVKKSVPVSSYSLNQKFVLEISKEVRCGASEPVFEGDEEVNSVSTLVLDSLQKCPPDTRVELAHGILFLGGTSMLPGFKTRLLRECSELVANQCYPELAGLHQQFRFVKTPFNANLIGWLAGAVVGSLDYWTSHGISKESFALSKVKRKLVL